MYIFITIYPLIYYVTLIYHSDIDIYSYKLRIVDVASQTEIITKKGGKHDQLLINFRLEIFIIIKIIPKSKTLHLW